LKSQLSRKRTLVSSAVSNSLSKSLGNVKSRTLRSNIQSFALHCGFATSVLCGSAALAQTDFITAPDQSLITQEDTSIPLQLSLEPGVLSGGATPDLISTAVGFRPAAAGATPTIMQIPAGTSAIRITGYSTEPDNTAQANGINDEYQTLNVQVDLGKGVTNGQVSYPALPSASTTVQYSWLEVPLGQSALSDPTRVVGASRIALSDPTIDVIGNELHITETHGLESAYLVEFTTSNGGSSNFSGAGSEVQTPGEFTSNLVIPQEVQPGNGLNGFIALNVTSASAGSDFQIEHKGLSRIVLDLESGLISGTIAAEQGETETNTVTYAFENYPLVDLRVGGTPVSVQSSSATIVGDTTSAASVNDDPTIYIDASGELVVTRSTDFANKYTTLYTAEFYERTGVSSIAGTIAVDADDALFDDNDDLFFRIPTGTSVGVLNLSWQTIGGTATNENVGLGFIVIDMNNLTSSGSIAFMRATTPDLVSWGAVPFGTTFFGATDAAGDPLFTANKTAGSFTDGFPETASLEIVDNADGTQSLKFNASSTVAGAFADYVGNGLMTWIGAGPLEISGLPLLGDFSHGVETAEGTWEVDPADISALAYIPNEHASGLEQFDVSLPTTGEVDSFTVDVQPVADPITLTVSDAEGLQNLPIAISAAISNSPDQDGSEVLSEDYTFSNVPASVTLASTAGSVIDNGGGNWTVNAAALAGC